MLSHCQLLFFKDVFFANLHFGFLCCIASTFAGTYLRSLAKRRRSAEKTKGKRKPGAGGKQGCHHKNVRLTLGESKQWLSEF